VGTGSTAGAAKVFAYPFKINLAADLTVTDYNIITSVGTVKTLDTDYAVSGVGAAGGGNVTLTGSYTNLSTSSWLVIQREVELTQETDYVENDPFSAETHEGALDKLCMADQQLQEQIDRCIKADIAQTSSSVTYTAFATLADQSTSSATVAVAQASNAVVQVTLATAQTSTATVYAAQASASAVSAAASAASASFSGVRVNFGSASLSSGVLDITHSKSLSTPYSIQVSVFGSDGYMVIPDNIVGSTNTVHIALSTANFTVTGTWSVLYIA